MPPDCGSLGSAPLKPEALTAEAFLPFGQVIQAPAHGGLSINDGTAVRHDALALVDAAGEGGRAIISLFVAQPRRLPFRLVELEKHPLGSQAFMPLDGEPYLVVVAPTRADGSPGKPRSFYARPDQGVNFDKGVWHHPLLALNKTCRFLVVDRAGPGRNLDVVPLTDANYQLEAPDVR